MRKVLGGIEVDKLGTPFHHKRPMKKGEGSWSGKTYFICRTEHCGRMIYSNELRDALQKYKRTP